ncbi:hypothetical protein HELRODRAFT_159699 [Helobdella robusta]|uniref:E3 ubiquitin-protein ligase n=1 Tax=Helobdella robusta TaxID=6412 RepID=T1EPB8_HELRO|nr:hypothetical protein HELRODRAFT_159699 [Helobdella robusta]ESO13094.1 hypothetical protein HELRODRAFT_159699 [Helobdella robusta]
MSRGRSEKTFKLCVNRPTQPLTSWTGLLRYDVILKVKKGNLRDDKCPICLEALAGTKDVVVYLKQCLHQYHLICLKRLYEKSDKKLKCPVCRHYYRLPRLDPSEFGTLYVYISEDTVRTEFEYHSIVLNIIDMLHTKESIEVVKRLLKAWKLGKLFHFEEVVTLMKCDFQSMKTKLDEWNIFLSDFVDEFADDNDMYGDQVDDTKYKRFQDPPKYVDKLKERINLKLASLKSPIHILPTPKSTGIIPITATNNLSGEIDSHGRPTVLPNVLLTKKQFDDLNTVEAVNGKT